MRSIAAAIVVLCLTLQASLAEPLALSVASAELGFDQRTSEPVVTVRLSEASKTAFSRFTADHIGRKTQIRVDSTLVAEPVIREPILGGSLQISGKFSAEQARHIAGRLSAGGTIEVEAVDR